MAYENLGPKRLRVREALKYLADKHDLRVSKVTFYQWVKRGVAGVTLRVSYVAGVTLTTEADLDAWAEHRATNLDPRYVR